MYMLTAAISAQAGAFTLGGMYTPRALQRISLSLDLRAEALEKLYPGYLNSEQVETIWRLTIGFAVRN
jgi:hypothetical protein